jgi:hypothetical protein
MCAKRSEIHSRWAGEHLRLNLISDFNAECPLCAIPLQAKYIHSIFFLNIHVVILMNAN